MLDALPVPGRDESAEFFPACFVRSPTLHVTVQKVRGSRLLVFWLE